MARDGFYAVSIPCLRQVVDLLFQGRFLSVKDGQVRAILIPAARLPQAETAAKLCAHAGSTHSPGTSKINGLRQFGARWIEDRDQPLAGTVFLVLGDSFSYGSGLQYEDTYVYKTQDLLARTGTPYTFLNFAQSGADVLAGLEIYRSLPDSISHDAIVYGLHLNDLIRFDTSSVNKNQALGLPLVKQSKSLEFISKKLNSSFGRYVKIWYLTSPEVFQREKSKQNMRALVQLDAIARRKNVRFYAAILPILVDVQKKTFAPVYLEIERMLREKGIKHIDLTGSLEAYEDRELWILPVDRHPNEIASEVFARSLASCLAYEVIVR